MKKRIFCTNDNGRDLFYIEIYDHKEMPSLWCRTSITAGVTTGNRDFHRLINCIEERKVPDELRTFFVSELIQTIKKIMNIEYFYFTDDVLDKNGKYSEEMNNTLKEIYDQIEIKDYEPLIDFDGYPFMQLCGYIVIKTQNNQVSECDQLLFEELVSRNSRLNNLYFDRKESQTKFYYCNTKKEGGTCDVYWMTNSSKPILCFLKESSN